MARLRWWNKTEVSAIAGVVATLERDPLITSFEDGMVLVAMEVEPDGSYQLAWSLLIHADRSLPEVEHFVAKVATYIIDEPIDRLDIDGEPT